MFGYVLLYLGRCAVATVPVLATCLWCSLRAATSNLPSLPPPPPPPTPSQTAVCSTMGDRKHKTVVFSQSNALRGEAHRTNLPLLAIGCRTGCSGDRRTSPFNGIERSLSRAVVIKTKSLPISDTTFARVLSLYIAHDGRKHNPTLSANKHVQICCSSLSAAADGLADGSGEHRTSPVNGIERSLSRAGVPKTKSLPVSATTFPTVLSLYIAQGRLRKDIRPLSKLFSKAEPVPFEKGNKRQLGLFFLLEACQRNAAGCSTIRQADPLSFPFPIVIHQSIDPAARAPKRQVLVLHALEHSTGSEHVDA